MDNYQEAWWSYIKKEVFSFQLACESKYWNITEGKNNSALDDSTGAYFFFLFGCICFLLQMFNGNLLFASQISSGLLCIATILIFRGWSKKFWRLSGFFFFFFFSLSSRFRLNKWPVCLRALRMGRKGTTSRYSRIWEESWIPVPPFCDGSYMNGI